MKKLLPLLCFLFLNQLSFSQTHHVLYGVTASGGSQNKGVIFQYDISTSVLTKKYDIFGGMPGGGVPLGSLVHATNGLLYGLESQDGDHGEGVLFSFNPTTSVYNDLYSFDGGGGGGYPYGSMMQASDGKLYGTASQGGIQDGLIYQFDISSSSMSGGYLFINIDGGTPFGDLIQATDGKLYGMTYSGGNNYGVIYQYTPSNTSHPLNDLYNFDYFTNGGNPQGTLLQATDGKFYGMVSSGGLNSAGVLFKFDVATSTFTKLLDFSSTNGSSPYGSLIQATDGNIYGMTNSGGTNNGGVLFQLDPTTSTYTKKYEFGSVNGANPYGTLMQASDGKIYGMTSAGGANGYGVLFQYDPATSSYHKKVDFNGANNGAGPQYTKLIEIVVPVGIEETPKEIALNVYPNPNNGKFIITIDELKANEQNANIEVSDLLGKIIYRAEIKNKRSEIDLSNYAKGIYTAKVIDGMNIYKGKIVIQ